MIICHHISVCSQYVWKTQHSFCLTATQLEPHDVAYFLPIKIVWQKILLSFKTGKSSRRIGLPNSNILSLLKQLLAALDEGNGAENVILGFLKTGIMPFNPQEVLNWLPSCMTETSNDVLNETELWKGKESKRTPLLKRINLPPGKSCSKYDMILVGDPQLSKEEEEETYAEKTNLPKKAHK